MVDINSRQSLSQAASQPQEVYEYTKDSIVDMT